MLEAEGSKVAGIMDLSRLGSRGEICNRVRESIMAVKEALEIASGHASSKAAAFCKGEISIRFKDCAELNVGVIDVHEIILVERVDGG